MNQHSPISSANAPEPATAPPPRRGTPFWKQVLVSIVVLGAGVGAWAYFFPESRAILASYRITIPGLPVETQTAARPSPGGPGAGPRGPGGGRASPVVVVAPVVLTTINDRLSAVGEGTAARSVTVTAGAAGTLAAVEVSPGERVEAGALIARLDSESEQISFDRANLAYTEAESALTRATELRAANAMSAVQFSSAQLALNQAQLERRTAELALDRRTIRSPISGTVGLMQLAPGNLVSAQSIVTTVEDSSEIRVDFWVPERYVGEINVGMPVSVTALAVPGLAVPGTILAVDNRIDTASRTLQVQARIPNEDGRLRPGMSLTVRIDFSGQSFPMVDPLSIQWSADGAYVWKYAEGKVQRAAVEIVERNSGGVLVTGEIAEGDQVVTQGVLQLQQGATVRLLDEVTAGGPPGGGPPGSGRSGPPGAAT